jgi:hypothetical protein
VPVQRANLNTMSLKRLPRPRVETAAALIGTAFSAILLVLTAMNAGPLWRDEINTLSMAQMPSLKDLWNNLPFESFPPLWPLLLRACGHLGLPDTDAGIRVLGLCVGLSFLASLWLCSRWMGGRAPILSIALLGSLPAFLFIVGANRAYGLAGCLLVLSFGMIWRTVESPTKSRVLGCGFICLLFAHCVYYDIVFLCAMLSGAAVVVIRRRQWKLLGALTGIGAACGASLAIYLPIIRRGSVYVPMNQDPDFNFATLWNRLGVALTARSSARVEDSAGPEIWIWVVLLMCGLLAALVAQRAWESQKQNQETAMASAVRVHADLALFCVASMILGAVGYSAFVLRLHYVTQAWYYVGMLSLCAVSLDGLLNANWPALRPWGLLRIGLLAAMMTWSARSAWEEAHTRRSNVDLIASVLGRKAAAGDLIVVQGAWEGITFNRYYHGQARWVTVPPIDSHKVHRTDLIMEKLHQPDPMAPVLQEITDTLREGNNVWIVGNMVMVDPTASPSSNPPAALWLSSYFDWCGQVTTRLQKSALQAQALEIPVDEPVNHLENLPVCQFRGYRSDADPRRLAPSGT